MTGTAPPRPNRAMVLAAGLGTRMRPLTDSVPKPLVDIAGRALIDRVLDRLAAFGIAEAVVNAHHLADRLQRHLAGRGDPPLRICCEAELLGVGGGVVNALRHLAPGRQRAPFFVANADALWLDGPTPALDRLADAWDDRRMDGLLLVMSAPRAAGMVGMGDFLLDPLGRLAWRAENQVAPYVYAGVQLVHRRLFAGAPSGPSAIAPLWDRALAAGRLYGLVHDGAWFHVGTPAQAAAASAELSGGRARWVDP